jgi:hypothetical protein
MRIALRAAALWSISAALRINALLIMKRIVAVRGVEPHSSVMKDYEPHCRVYRYLRHSRPVCRSLCHGIENSLCLKSTVLPHIAAVVGVEPTRFL